MSASPEKVVTRFAPSPTGFLHIGGARTALFNYLFARRHGGDFLLRIEDTDRARSTQAAIDAIIAGLRWLGLSWDGETVFQSQRAVRHTEVAQALLAAGQAYRCYATPEELETMRAAARAAGAPIRYNGLWRERDPADAPAGAPFVIRLKAPQGGETVIDDAVQGRVTVQNGELDDFILLRSDGTPTYMLAVVVDDHDMGVTHLIRGDDHLNNAFRQLQIIRAMGWPEPVYAHIPLIHGADGAKLSKRHGALGVHEYARLGILPAALENYLLRLGWSHGDDEIISRAQAIDWFGLDSVGRNPARFDMAKLESVNSHYLRGAEPEALLPLLIEAMEAQGLGAEARAHEDRLLAAIPMLAERARTINALADAAAFLVRPRPIAIEEKARASLTGDAVPLLQEARAGFAALQHWTNETVDQVITEILTLHALGFAALGKPLRAAVCGTLQAPSLVDVLLIFGKDETLARIDDVLSEMAQT